ncbi:MAG: EAL domain-containing protein, partial [Pseudomonadota bacterium]
IRDVTDEKRAQERLLHDAVHCSMTGLPNRELLVDRLDMSLSRASDEQRPGPAVILIDIDQFRRVNAAHGFVIGDSLLLTIARRLQSYVGAQDTLARLGGNQFGLIVHNHESTGLAGFTENLRKAVRTPIQVGGQEVVLTGALGVALSEPGERDPDVVLKDAEIALYRAKRAGADRIELFRPEMRGKPDETAKLASDLRAAIERQQVEVVFSPIIYLPTEVLSGFQASLRWRHPSLGLLNASDFVSIAERHDLAGPLTALLLKRATAEAAKWQKQLPRNENPLYVSVGLTSRQILGPDLVQEIRRTVSSTPLPTDGLRVEVSESILMDNPEQVTSILTQLREAGARIALDDFGTGFSSLAYLQRFPFDSIKIDEDLVQASGDNAAGTTLVRSIVALGHELGKKIVAEGVDAPETAMFLRSLGCEFAQGFYYGEAMTVREVADLLKVVRRAERKLQRSLFKVKPTALPKPAAAAAQAPSKSVAAAAAAAEASAANETPDPGAAPAMPATERPGTKRTAGAKAEARRQARKPAQTKSAGQPAPPDQPTAPPIVPAAGNGHPPPPPNGADAAARPQTRPPPLQSRPGARTAPPPPPMQASPAGAPPPPLPAGQPARSPEPTSAQGGRPAPNMASGDADLVAQLASLDDGAAPEPPPAASPAPATGGRPVTAPPPMPQASAPPPPPVQSANVVRLPTPPAGGPAPPAPPQPQPTATKTQPPPAPAARPEPKPQPPSEADQLTAEKLKTLPPGIAASLARLAGIDPETGAAAQLADPKPANEDDAPGSSTAGADASALLKRFR